VNEFGDKDIVLVPRPFPPPVFDRLQLDTASGNCILQGGREWPGYEDMVLLLELRNTSVLTTGTKNSFISPLPTSNTNAIVIVL